MGRHSGLQRDVLSLYRQLLRVARQKGGADSSTVAYVESEFRRQAEEVSKRDFQLIEHSLRYGHKQLKLLQMPGVAAAAAVRAAADAGRAGTADDGGKK